MTPPSPSQREVTRLLGDWSGGNEQALAELIPLVQPELHRLAHHYMSRERAGHTLQTLALTTPNTVRFPPFTFFGVRSLGSGTVSTVPLPIVEPDWLLVWFPGLGRTTPNTIRRKSQNNAQH